MTGMRETSIAPVAGAAPGLAATAGVFAGFIDASEASWLWVGSVLAALILAGGGRDTTQDQLYPARLQLARFRRSERPADVLLVRLPRGTLRPRRAGGHSASAACAVLRVTDGVAVLPSFRGCRLCAVIEPDSRARRAIESRLRNACGEGVGLGWATFPKDGATLESLVAVAAGRVPEPVPPPRTRRVPQLDTGPGLATRDVGSGRTWARRAR
jgi:hypothetical protein